MKCVCGSTEFMEKDGRTICKKCGTPQKKQYKSLYTDPFGGEKPWKQGGF